MSSYTDILFDHTKTPEQRIQAVFHLLANPSAEALDAMIYGLFNDPNQIVRHECAYCLGEMNSEKGSIALIQAIKTDVNRFVIHESMLAVANLGDKAAEPVLKEFMNHSDPDIVDTADISLQRLEMKLKHISINKENAKNIILDPTSSKEERIQSSFKLVEDNSDDAVDTLIDALKQEKSPIVKHEIIFSLGETASSKAVNALIDTLSEDTNAFVVHESLLSLATIGNKDSEHIIKKYLDHEDEDIAFSASIALERLYS